MATMGERRFCETCRRSATIVDEFLEADHGLAGAMQWLVIELSCGHYRTGTERPAVLGLL